MSRFDCLDCRVNTSDIEEYYMVTDRVWEEATQENERDEMLCIGCLENRLGRKLIGNDFSGAPINRLKSERSERLRDRLFGDGTRKEASMNDRAFFFAAKHFPHLTGGEIIDKFEESIKDI